MKLDDKRWIALSGGNGFPYNASKTLRLLQDAKTQTEILDAFDALWENLHDHGKVGTAAYFAVAQLVSICMEKHSLNWNYIGLCVVIEHCRLQGGNPAIPDDFVDEYMDALQRFEAYLLENFTNITDRESLRLSLALFATLHGQPDLGRAIELLNDITLTKILS